MTKEVLQLESSTDKRTRELTEFKEKWEQYQKDRDIYKLLGLSPTCTEEEIKSAQNIISKLLHSDKNQGLKVSDELTEWAVTVWKELNETLSDSSGKKWLKEKMEYIANQRNVPITPDITKQKEVHLNNIIDGLSKDIEAAYSGNCIYEGADGKQTKTSIYRFVTGSNIGQFRFTKADFKSTPKHLAKDTHDAFFDLSYIYVVVLRKASQTSSLYSKKSAIINTLKALIDVYKKLSVRWYKSHYVPTQSLEEDKELKNLEEIIQQMESKSIGMEDQELELLSKLELAVKKLPHIGNFIEEKLVNPCLECNVFEIIANRLLEKVQTTIGTREIPNDLREEIEFVRKLHYPKPFDISTPENVQAFVEKRVAQIWQDTILPKISQVNKVKVNIDPNCIYLISPFFDIAASQNSSYYYLDTSDMSTMQMYQIEANGKVISFSISINEMTQYIPLSQILLYLSATDEVIEGLKMAYGSKVLGYYFYEQDGKILLKTTSTSQVAKEQTQPLPLGEKEKEKITTKIAEQIVIAISKYREEKQRKNL